MLTPLYGSPGPLAVATSRFDPINDPDTFLDLDFSGLSSGLIWQEPSQTNATGNNQAIGRIRDRSRSGYHHDQSTSGNKPTWRSSVWNGLGMADPDGSNDYLDYGSPICNSSKLTMFAVVQVTRTSFPGPSDTLDTIWTSGNSGNVAYGACTYNWYGDPNNNRFSADPALNGNATVNGTTRTLPYTLPNSTATYILSATYATAPSSNTGSRLFMYRNGILPGKVRLGRLILVNRTMTVAEQFPFLTYLNRIWQVY